MSFVAVAIGGAALIGAGATAYSASEASAAQEEANKANREATDATNRLNYEMFLQSRGSQGQALLPMYFSRGTEQQLGQRAFDTWLALNEALGTPADQLRGYESVVRSLTPAQAESDILVNQLFSGELARQQEQNIAPVLAARGAVAGAQKQGILEGLIQRLNAISADRARAGYQGGGSAFERARLRGATIPMLQEAATVGAQADLANAQDVANIRNNAIATRLNNLSLPLTQAANRLQFQNLPATAAGATTAAMLSPFDWFRIQPQAFQAERPPLVQPVASAGQIATQGVGQLGSTVGNYFATRSLINQLNQPTNYGITPAQQNAMMNEYYFGV